MHPLLLYYTILCQHNAAVIFGVEWISLQSIQIACCQVLSTSVKTHSNSSDSFSMRCITSFSNCDLFIRRCTRHNLYLSVCSTETLAERNKSSLGGVPAEILTGITEQSQYWLTHYSNSFQWPTSIHNKKGKNFPTVNKDTHMIHLTLIA